MTIASATNRVTFAGDAATTSFATTPVKFFDTSDLLVYATVDATGAATLLVEGTGYTVSGGSASVGAVGTVDTSAGSAPYGAPATGVTLSIIRELPLLQGADFVQNDASNADVAEAALDKLVLNLQRVDERVDRSLRQPDGDLLDIGQLPDAVTRASKVLTFDASGNPLAGTITGVPVAFTPVTESFNGTGAQTAFTLAQAAAESAIIARIDGVLQTAGVDYTVSGSTLTFTTAPALGTGNVVVQTFGFAASVGTVSVDQVTGLAASTGASKVGFVQAGSGATAETVQSALRDLRAGISTDTVYSRWYRADATFNGTVDHGTFLGYNITGFGQIDDASKASLMCGFEADFNDGSVRLIEFHTDLAVPGGSFKRPFAAAMAITGGNAGKLVNVDITSEVNINARTSAFNFEAAAAYTTGMAVHLISLDTGGSDWLMLSTGSGAGLGAGHLAFYNITDGRYALIADDAGNVVLGNLAAIATTATDGFAYVPTCAGTPTGVPTSKTGKAPIVVDTTNNKLYFYSGGAWRDAGP